MIPACPNQPFPSVPKLVPQQFETSIRPMINLLYYALGNQSRRLVGSFPQVGVKKKWNHHLEDHLKNNPQEFFDQTQARLSSFPCSCASFAHHVAISNDLSKAPILFSKPHPQITPPLSIIKCSQPKQCIIMWQITPNYHTFLLFWFPRPVSLNDPLKKYTLPQKKMRVIVVVVQKKNASGPKTKLLEVGNLEPFNFQPENSLPKNHWMSKLVVWRSQTPAIHIQTPL